MRNSKIILVKHINIDRDYINVLDYTTEQMLALCNQNKVAEANDYSFIRTNRSIMTSFTYEQCLQANYIAFQNSDYSNKWFFAWIDEVNYKGDRNTELTYTIDSWSTWFDNWQAKTCFVSREHVNDDTIGLHTLNENLNVGEVVEEKSEELFGSTEDEKNLFYYAINGTYNPYTKKDFDGVEKINGNLTGTYIFLFDVYDGSVGIPNINNFLQDVNKDGKIESVKEIYILPKNLVDSIGTRSYTNESTFGSYSFKLLNTSDSIVEISDPIEKITSFSDFTPKNNKCFVYPYNYLLVSNNVGNTNIYKYENFKQANPIFSVEMAVSVGASVRFVPREYKNVNYNYDESIQMAKFPTCSWASDAFTNWLTQNSVNIITQTVGTATSLASGNLGSIAGNVAGLIGQFYQANLLPSKVGGNNNGDVNFCSRHNTFTLHYMRAKTEYLRIIDDYFTRFGYQINRVKVPNITGRRYWNYVEIGQSEEIGTGTVPTKFMVNINNACKKGVTIWHNHSNIGNFNLDNSII